MDIKIINNKLVVEFKPWDFKDPMGAKLFSMVKNIPHRQNAYQFTTSTSYERYLSEIFFYPFTRREIEEGEREYREFIDQFN